MPIDGRARKGNMGENHVRRAEDEVFKLDVGIDRHGIAQPTRVSDDRVPLDIGVLAQAAVLSDHGARGDMREKPDFGVLADLCAVLHHRRRMDEGRGRILFRFGQLIHLFARCSTLTANGQDGCFCTAPIAPNGAAVQSRRRAQAPRAGP